jgi:O-acetyl-ADP-ribose deacetylase (regulator of RNase III)
MTDAQQRIEIVQGDITDMDVDAIVNAANTDLELGSGVAGAIRNKGGPSIQRECDEHGPISLGQAALTGAGDLKTEYVIHAAGMRLGGVVNRESLIAATENSLIKASENRVKALAFPAIGTGVGGFPADECANIMIDIVLEYLSSDGNSIEKVYFVLFDDHTYKIFKEVLENKTKT